MPKYLLLALAASALWTAGAAAHESKVTVHRGADTHAVEIDAQGNAEAAPMRLVRVEESRDRRAHRDGGTYRGHHRFGPHVTGPFRHKVQAIAETLGGRTLWIVDESGDRLIACRLHKTFRVGDHDIRCESEELSRALREAEERR